MADNKVVSEIQVNLGNAPQTVGEMRQEFKDLTKEIGNTVQGTEEYYGKLKRLGELKGDLKDLKEDIKSLDPQEIFKGFQGALTGILGGFTAAQGAVALFGGKNEELEKTLVKVNAALALLQGFQAFSDGLRKASILVNTYIAATQASTIATQENAVAQEAATVAGAANTAAIEGETVVTEAATVATEGFSAALKAIGIGLIIAAIAGLLALVNSYNDGIKEAAENTKKLNEETIKFADIGLKGEQAALARTEELELSKAKAKGASEEEQTAIQLKYQQARIDALKRHNKETFEATDGNTVEEITALKDAVAKKEVIANEAAGKAREKAEADAKAALAKQKENNDKRIALELDLAKKLADAQATQSGNNAQSAENKSLADAQASRDKDLQQLKEYLRDKVINVTEYNSQVSNVQQTYNLQLLNINAVYLKAKADEDKAALEKEKQAKQKASDELVKQSQENYLAQQEQLLKEFVGNEINQKEYNAQSLQNKILSDQQLLESDALTAEARRNITKDLLDNQLKQEQDYNALRTEAINNNALTAQTELDQRRQQNLIDEDTYQVQLAQITLDKNQALLDDAIAKGEETVKFESDLTEAKIALAQKEKEAKVNLLADVGTALGQLSDIAGKQTTAGKALAIAQTTIATYQSATQAFNSLSGIPIVGPVLGGIAAAAAVVTGIANVKKIVSVQVPGGGSGGGSTPSPTSYTAPAIPTGTNVTSLSGSSLNAITARSNTPVRAYVVESQITSTQQNVRGYQEQGSIGGNGYNNQNGG